MADPTHAHPHPCARFLLQGLALFAILALANGWSATPAKADGDPASDVLATQQLFLPQDAAVPLSQQTQLAALLQNASRDGYPIRVALIASAADLGSVTGLWHQPQNYAQFLGQELSLIYRGQLLVVMPDGFGLYHFTGALASERSALAGANPSAGLGTAALAAIRNLAAAAGHPLPLPAASSTGSRAGNGSVIPWITFTIGIILVALAWTASLRARPPSLRSRKSSPA